MLFAYWKPHLKANSYQHRRPPWRTWADRRSCEHTASSVWCKTSSSIWWHRRQTEPCNHHATSSFNKFVFHHDDDGLTSHSLTGTDTTHSDHSWLEVMDHVLRGWSTFDERLTSLGDLHISQAYQDTNKELNWRLMNGSTPTTGYWLNVLFGFVYFSGCHVEEEADDESAVVATPEHMSSCVEAQRMNLSHHFARASLSTKWHQAIYTL